MRVLVVDDSIAYRKTISQILSECDGINVVAEVQNGKIALQKLEQEQIDLITLDLEMPEMDGLTTLREIKDRKINVKVIVFASQTARGADSAMSALELGAIDLVPKPSREYDSIRDAYDHVRELLLPRILIFNQQQSTKVPQSVHHIPAYTAVSPPADASQNPSAYPKSDLKLYRPKLIVVGSSTGGPTALEKFFTDLPPLRVPIVVAQHMPALFTKSLADRLAKISGIKACEAESGKILENQIYIAPGDYHTEIIRVDNGDMTMRVHQGPKRQNVRPCVDILFESAAALSGINGRVMAFVLTGMGYDGREGCQALKKSGGAVMIQDEASSVVWGMPGAVYESGAFDEQGDLDQCREILKRMISPIGAIK